MRERIGPAKSADGSRRSMHDFATTFAMVALTWASTLLTTGNGLEVSNRGAKPSINFSFNDSD
jgi:hypothetical protein